MGRCRPWGTVTRGVAAALGELPLGICGVRISAASRSSDLLPRLQSPWPPVSAKRLGTGVSVVHLGPADVAMRRLGAPDDAQLLMGRLNRPHEEFSRAHDAGGDAGALAFGSGDLFALDRANGRALAEGGTLLEAQASCKKDETDRPGAGDGAGRATGSNSPRTPRGS